MPALVRAAVAGDTPRVTLIADHITLMTGILTRHHSGEDKHIWPDLLHGVARVLLGAEQPAGLGDGDEVLKLAKLHRYRH
jgi:hypothetical protein